MANQQNTTIEENAINATQTIRNYCNITGCNKCKIKDIIGCGTIEFKCCFPHMWEPNEQKEGESTCS